MQLFQRDFEGNGDGMDRELRSQVEDLLLHLGLMNQQSEKIYNKYTKFRSYIKTNALQLSDQIDDDNSGQEEEDDIVI
ncbi:hypothetical protein BSLG_002021 [Batrachochytrium salamandrivorans]|nr:hypothetical protein BSLG_002021 [Batrachochytrium salamandrivorans]